MSSTRFIEAVGADLRYAARSLLRTPAFSLTAILCLAIGIGANTTMFGVVDALLLRPPAHVVDPHGLVKFHVTRTFPGLGRQASETIGYLDYTDFRDQTRSFSGTAAYVPFQEITLGRGADAQQVRASLTTASFFPLLGVRPALGRFYGPDDDRVGAPPVVVLDYGFWERHFASDPKVLGRQLRLANEMYTVIGVAPKGFTGVGLASVDLWIPLSDAASPNLLGPEWLTSRGWFFLQAVARLRPGVTLAQAEDDATRAHRAGRGTGPREDPDARVTLGGIVGVRNSGAVGISVGGPLIARTRGVTDAEISLWLAGVAAVVLLIACANVANLLITRAVRRQREIAIRLALGIGQARLVRQLVTESLVLAAVGGVAGLLLAHWGGAVIRHFLLPNVAALDAPLDGRVLLFTLAATAVTGLLCGAAPATQASRPDLTNALKAGAREGTYRRSPVRTGLLVAQVALSLVLLVGAGLFVRSLRNVHGVDFGFDVDKLILARMNLAGAGYTPAQVSQFFAEARDRVAALPGVESASTVVAVPFNSAVATTITIPGRDTLPQVPRPPLINPVSPEFFRTTGTRILRGRGFTAADGAATSHVVVINQAMAELYWPGVDPVGRCFKIGGARPPAPDTIPCSEIIGVAANTKNRDLREEPGPQYYVPIAAYPQFAMRALLVRAKGDPTSVVGSVRRTMQSMGAELPYADVRPFSDLLGGQIRPWKLGAMMFGIFGAVALLLAVIGLYGVLAYGVTQRRQEIGVRIALGARPGDVLRIVVGEGVRVALIGVAIGALVALAGGRLVQALLFDVTARDPLTFVVTTAVLLAASVVASAVPAWRAVRVDPAVALRTE